MGDLVLNAAALGSSAYPVRDARRIIVATRTGRDAAVIAFLYRISTYFDFAEGILSL